jgi:hypothetical protein
MLAGPPIGAGSAEEVQRSVELRARLIRLTLGLARIGNSRGGIDPPDTNQAAECSRSLHFRHSRVQVPLPDDP